MLIFQNPVTLFRPQDFSKWIGTLREKHEAIKNLAPARNIDEA